MLADFYSGSCYKLNVHLFFQIEISDTEHTLEITLEIEIVTEIADNPPRFAQARYSFPIREDDEDGTQLGDLRASDDG